MSSLKGDRRAYELAAFALHDPDDRTRRAAVLAVRWLAEPAAIEHLIPLTHDRDVHVRSVVGETIGSLAVDSDRLQEATATLLSQLAAPAPEVRAGTGRGLGVLGGPLGADDDNR